MHNTPPSPENDPARAQEESTLRALGSRAVLGQCPQCGHDLNLPPPRRQDRDDMSDNTSKTDATNASGEDQTHDNPQGQDQRTLVGGLAMTALYGRTGRARKTVIRFDGKRIAIPSNIHEQITAREAAREGDLRFYNSVGVGIAGRVEAELDSIIPEEVQPSPSSLELQYALFGRHDIDPFEER